MASLVLGVAGGLAFGPIGFLVGSMIGNMLFPTKQEGPRLSDLRLSGSSYGTMIPIPYGTVRSSPQIVWQTDLKEHSHHSGGKGGPDITTFTYSVSFAVKVAKGPIGGFLKIWFDSVLVWDVTPNTTIKNSKLPITLYLGVETANPDPTMEADLGVGKVPAFRDDAAIVFTDLNVSDYGNRIPNISVQYFSLGGTIPWRVSSFDATNIPSSPSNIQATYEPTTGIITMGYYEAPGGDPNSLTYTTKQFKVDGTYVGGTGPDPCDNLAGMGPTTGGGQVRNLQACFITHNGEPKAPTAGWYVGTSMVAAVNGGGGSTVYNPVYQHGHIFAVSGIGSYSLDRWKAPNGVPTATIDKTYSLGIASSLSNIFVSTNSEMNRIWVHDNGVPVGGSTTPCLWLFDEDLNLLHSWSMATLPGGYPAPNSPCTKFGYRNLLAFNSWVDTTAPSGPGVECYVYQLNGDFTFTRIGGIIQREITPIIQLQEGIGLGIGTDGVISLDPPQTPVTLGYILSDISVRDGLRTDEIDVSKQTQLVDGYLITNLSDGRTAIAPLQRAYYVDAVESSGKVVFVNRGAVPTLTIPDNDLAAQTPGTTPPPIATIKRIQEVDLPAIVNVNYLNEGASYQTGSQQASRQVTKSQAVAKIDLAIAMYDGKAKQVANVLLFEGWQERMTVVLLTSRKYSYLEPTDVINAHGYILRVVKKSDIAAGIMQLECVETLPAIYTTAFPGSPGFGGDQTSPPIDQDTILFLLDISLLDDADDPTAVYVAMCGAIDSSWVGGGLVKSTDGGTTYNSVGTMANASVIGKTTTVLGDFFGGNVFDELNSVTIVIGVGGGTLAGATMLAVLGGANKVLVGNEILQYKNATLIAPNTYVLSGLLRGRRNTEQFTGTHIIGERFVAGPLLVLPEPTGDLYQSRLFKGVTFGDSQAAATAIPFTDTGAVYRPYSPAQVGAAADASGNVTVNWLPRTRIGGAWIDYADITRSEPNNFVLQWWDASYSICARVTPNIAALTGSYSAAQQTTDFGRVQAQLFGSIANVGPFGLGTQTKFTVNAGGAGNDLPITPVQPYVLPPIAPPPGSTRPVDYVFAFPADSRIQHLIIPHVFVGQFTTSAAVIHGGSILAVEYLSTGTPRKMQLSTDSGGVNTVGAPSLGNTVSLFFGTGAGQIPLSPSTTYYVSIAAVNPDGSPSGPLGYDAEMRIDLGNFF